LEENEVPSSRKLIHSHWVFKIKQNPDGSIDKYKSRLVIKGYSQVSGIDFDETFAPVTRYDSLRILITIAASQGLKLYQADIKGAFLNGRLDEEIYMLPPPGLGLEGKVLKLRRALYGLKQGLLKWYERLTEKLIEWGFKRAYFDPCIFSKLEDKIHIAIYVDDLTFAVENDEIYESTLSLLRKEFKISKTGPLRWLLGIEIIQKEKEIILSQESYVEKILDRFGYTNLHSVKTPIEST
jgi:hypothetical protein